MRRDWASKRAKGAFWFRTIAATEPKASKRRKPTSMKDITHHAQEARLLDLGNGQTVACADFHMVSQGKR